MAVEMHEESIGRMALQIIDAGFGRMEKGRDRPAERVISDRRQGLNQSVGKTAQ